MGQNVNPETKQGFKHELETILTKENQKRLALMSAGVAAVFFLVPLILKLFPVEIQANGEILRLLVLNQIFIGIVGWQSNYFGKYGIYIPMIFIIVFALSELVFYKRITWSVEVEYIQTGYILFFLRKFVARKMALDEKRKNKPFPKSVTGRK